MHPFLSNQILVRATASLITIWTSHVDAGDGFRHPRYVCIEAAVPQQETRHSAAWTAVSDTSRLWFLASVIDAREEEGDDQVDGNDPWKRSEWFEQHAAAFASVPLVREFVFPKSQ